MKVKAVFNNEVCHDRRALVNEGRSRGAYLAL